MLHNRNKFHFVTICCWLSLLNLSTRCCIHALSIQQQTHSMIENEVTGNRNVNGNGNAPQSDATALNFSPRMEYNNEWRPVGRGDPLKNDPTYDYSPPALERVRYWRADNESKSETNHPKHHKKDSTVNGKKEILLLGMPSERQRGQPIHVESSIYQQPKYTSIRRSYYAHQHQLPTHLMPPPMQTLSPTTNSIKNNVGAVDYRHNMPLSPTTTTTTKTAMMHSKPYYSTSASLPWMHTSMTSMMPLSVSTSPAIMMQHYRQQQTNAPHMPFHDHDHHHQESVNQFSYTRPNVGAAFTVNNFIDSNQSPLKPRKPWLHELLQKEVVKTPSNAPSVHKYSMNSEQMYPIMGISTTYSPVEFVPLPASITPPPPPSPQTTASTTTQLYTTTSPVYFTTTMPTIMTTTPTPPHHLNTLATPITTSNRLLIPTTSNLKHRPTVTPIEMTTDALFKHYKQPERPLLGPMYLIIEGHSKVKTYGKDELDPHQPKIVPVIPKREPVVHIGNPNEKRGTVETFKVKHLHTKPTTPLVETTQSTEKVTTTKTTTPTSTTTNQPKTTNATKVVISIKNLSTTTSTTTTTESTPIVNAKQAINETTKLSPQLQANEAPTGMEGFFSFLDSSFGSLFNEAPMMTSEIKNVDPIKPSSDKLIFVTTTPSATILQPIATTTSKSSNIEARIGTHGGSIQSLIDFNDEEMNSNADKATTEPAPRDVRQIFDYDQLPESRLKDRMDVQSNENNDNSDDNDNDNDNDDDDDNDNDDEGVISMLDDSDEDIDMEDVGSLTPEEYDDNNHELIRRIDKLVDDIDDDKNEEAEFEELLSAEDDHDDDHADALEKRRSKEA